MSKKVLIHNFLPNKAQEEGGSSNINNHGGVVEIRTEGLPSNHEWSISRKVGADEIRSGKLNFCYHETLERVYTSRGGNRVVKSPEGVCVLLYDLTEDPPVEYETSLIKAPRGVPFRLIWGAFIRDRRVHPEDEIVLSCDATSGTFMLESFLRRA